MWVSSRYVSSDLGNLEHIMFFLWAFVYHLIKEWYLRSLPSTVDFRFSLFSPNLSFVYSLMF